MCYHGVILPRPMSARPARCRASARVDYATLTDRLAERGMVRRRRAELDRRGVVVELTARGEVILRKLALNSPSSGRGAVAGDDPDPGHRAQRRGPAAPEEE